MPERPLFRCKVDELRGIASTGRPEDVARVLAELEHRTTPSAIALCQELRVVQSAQPSSRSLVRVSTPAELDPARRESVEKARASWIKKLVDLSRRNNLLYFRSLKTGTLDLTAAAPSALADLLHGESVSLRDLLAADSFDLERAGGSAFEIRRKAQENEEERGLRTLYLALGSATWTPADGGRPADSPVLLLPVVVESRGREGHNLAIRREGDLQANEVLLQALEDEHGVRVSAEDLLTAAEPRREGNGGRSGGQLRPEAAYAKVRELASPIPGLTVNDRVILGNFSFQKMAIVRDLKNGGEAMAAHDLVAALAGVAEARDGVRSVRSDLDPHTLDSLPPDQEFLILDADSSQQRVVQAVLAGQDGVIQGPPGTGKSQTIANLIAELAARGKKVLFVAEKRAALEVVLDRLDKAGLGHLALDLHGAEVSRRDVLRKLGESFEIVQGATHASGASLFETFARDRERLNAHTRRMHSPRTPSGLSVYTMQGHLLGIPAECRSSLRWRGRDLDRLEAGVIARSEEDLRDLGGLAGLFIGTDRSAWTGSHVVDGAAAQAASDLAQELNEDLAHLTTESARVAGEAGFTPSPTLSQLKADIALWSQAEKLLSSYDQRVTTEPLEALARDLAPAGRAAARIWAWATSASFRAAVRRMQELRKVGKTDTRTLLSDAQAGRDLVAGWRRRVATSVRIRAPHGLASIRALHIKVRENLTRLGHTLNEPELGDCPISELQERLASLAADTVTPHRVARLHQLTQALEARGLAPLVTEIKGKYPDPSLWIRVLRYAWLSSCMDRAMADDPEVAAFNGRSHDEIVREFRELDEQRIRFAAARVVRAHAERAVKAMNGNPGAEALVRREAQKRNRHMPLRKLMEEAGDVVSALRPCLMASPLSVSQLLPGGAPLFDVVLFDEASQILPEDAVAALLRGRRAVVAGDPHQLPPTAFFAAQDDAGEVDPDSTIEGFESLLDLLLGFLPPWTLDWHYRSLDESLIAFSNRHIYADRLVTFPGVGRLEAVAHVLVDRPAESDADEESASAEVRRVVELVLEHAEQRPEQTLGVIAMGIKHQQRIEAQLERAREDRAELDPFFDSTRKERFFVKNLERVQGDERDSIILSVGYGKDRTGRLVYRFGPLLTKGGERRLNVAITRARRNLTLVSSFSHRDMDPDRCKSRGMSLLRQYIEFVYSGGRTLGTTLTQPTEMNDFERDIHDALSAEGMSLEPQWGASRYRIDFAAKHPQQPGRFVLAIECDGATYHSAPTARDRDRLRQKHLEALGWRFHRIWSTDWYLNRKSEVARALACYQAAVQASDGPEPPPGPAPVPSALESDADAWQTRRPAAGRRGPRPNVPSRQSIDEYSDAEITQLVLWIESGTLRTVQQLIDETIEELGFRRKGKRIVARVRDLITRLHARRGAA